jgi:hypothetical protein
MEENYYQSPAASNDDQEGLAKRDRSGRLRVMGIFQIVLGSLSILFTLLTAVGMVLANAFSRVAEQPEMPLASVVSSLLFYVLASVFFFVVGFGSIKARRWVRPVVLSLMWPSLVLGILGFAFAVLALPGWFELTLPAATPGMQLPSALMTLIMVVTLAVMFVIAVAIPGLHVLVYQSRHVKATCERLDPKERWTDRCPTKVLGVVITIVCVGLLQLGTLGLGFTWFFGLVITGVPAAVLCLVEAAAALVIARMVYRLTVRGWWAGLFYLLFVCLKLAISFLVMDFVDIYRTLGLFPEQQLKMMEQLFQLYSFSAITFAMWSLAALVAVVYMKLIRKHFA